jgi:hypothetical protein
VPPPLPLLDEELPLELPLAPLLPPELELLELAEPPLDEPLPPHSDKGTHAFTWAPLAVARVVQDSAEPQPASPLHFAAQ